MSYLAVLQRLWGFYWPLELQLFQVDWKCSGIAFEERRKAGWIERDLAHFGMAPSSILELEQCEHLPRANTLSYGVGALYVLEGATLGGQVILQTLERQLGILPETGGRFYASYGRDIGVMWRKYLVAMERTGQILSVVPKIEAGAVLTFTAFNRWLENLPNPETHHG